MTTEDKMSDLGKILRQRRVMIPMTLRELSAKSGVSESHLARIERGGRFPSAGILRKIARPLGIGERKLFTLADYLPPQSSNMADSFSARQLDPYVAAVLSQEPVEIQRTVVTVLSVLRNMAKSIAQENSRSGTRGSTGANPTNPG